MQDIFDISFGLWSALLAFGFFQGLFLAIVLLVGFKRNTSSALLTALLLILVCNLFNYLIIDSGLYHEVPHLVYVATPLLFLIGPFYYLYVKSILDVSIKIQVRHLKHFVFFIMACAYFYPFYILTGHEKVALLQTLGNQAEIPLTMDLFILLAVMILQSFFYVVQTSMLIRKKQKEVLTTQVELRLFWLRRFTLGFGAYWLLDFAGLMVFTIGGSIYPEVFYFMMLSNTVIINVLVFFAISRNKEFGQVILADMNAKYKKSGISLTNARTHMESITNIMAQDMLYLDPELSLAKLASRLDLPPHVVSQVLNLELGKNFYEFINEYRFKEVQNRLQKPEYQHLTILGIALDSGFNNKNTFNKVFKKHAGLTPTQYLKSLTRDLS